jgi:hypothetical protein
MRLPNAPPLTWEHLALAEVEKLMGMSRSLLN